MGLKLFSSKEVPNEAKISLAILQGIHYLAGEISIEFLEE